MASKPSWLDDEENQAAAVSTAKTLAANPVAQKVAKDPKVQAAVKDAFVTAAVSSVQSDPSAPAWASDTYTPPAVPGAATTSTDRGSIANPNPNAGKEFECDPELLRDMKRWHLYLRIAYMIAAIILGLAGGLELASSPGLGQFFFAFYVLFFSLLICCFEVGLDSISRLIAINFGFLYTVVGKVAFLLFVGFMSFSLGLCGKVAMAYLYAVYCFQLYIYFKFPRYVLRW